MAAYEIPLSPEAQNFNITLAGVVYQVRLLWNQIASCWVIDIADSDGHAIINGIPLVVNGNLLSQFDYLGFGGSLVATTDNDVSMSPASYNGLGSTGHLYFITP